jgi:hypothetical protein
MDDVQACTTGKNRSMVTTESPRVFVTRIIPSAGLDRVTQSSSQLARRASKGHIASNSRLTPTARLRKTIRARSLTEFWPSIH